VVDNASSDGTAPLVQLIQTRGTPFPVRYVFEPQLGKSFALNRGVEDAGGEFLLFTDDDVVVTDGWADALCGALARPGVGAVGGRILPQWPYPPPRWLQGPHAEALTLHDHGPAPRPPFDRTKLHQEPTIGGANMAVRAELLGSAPPFNPVLGPRGKLRIQYEEHGLLERIAASHLLVYEPTAVVFHRIQPERMDLGWIRRSNFQAGFGNARSARMRAADRTSFPRRLVRAIRYYRRARAIRRANSALPSLDPANAWREVHAFLLAGEHVEGLLVGFPTLANWAADHLA
jgi:glucosyl-dolichyl phosphate glucuronosyltransferase